MYIQINVNNKKQNAILEEAMERINRIARNEQQWKKHERYDYYEIECNISEEDILSVFQELITKYPFLDISASCTYDIREDDRSAQWWVTTNIKTEHHPDGTTTLSIDSSTQWF